MQNFTMSFTYPVWEDETRQEESQPPLTWVNRRRQLRQSHEQIERQQDENRAAGVTFDLNNMLRFTIDGRRLQSQGYEEQWTDSNDGSNGDAGGSGTDAQSNTGSSDSSKAFASFDIESKSSRKANGERNHKSSSKKISTPGIALAVATVRKVRRSRADM